MSTLIQQLYNSLALASIYTLVALGITLVYGLTRLVNFAHGQMLTLGAFVSFSLVQSGVPYGIAIILAFIGVGLAGEVLDLTVFRRTMSRPLNGFIVSLGLISIFEAAFVIRWGTDSYQLRAPFNGLWTAGPLRLDQPRLMVIVVTAIACTALFLVLERTDVGRSIRALAEDGTAARVLGVPVGKMISVTFFVGTGLAALAGALLATVFPFNAFSGGSFLLKGFAVAIIGGLGNVRGAVVAAALLAVSEALGAGYISVEWSAVFGLGAMTLILALRPAGLFHGTEATSEDHFGSGWAAMRATGDRRAVAVAKDRRRQIFVSVGPIVLTLAFLIALPSIVVTHRGLSIGTAAVVTAIVGYSLWLTFHYAGMLTIVQGALMGVGAYTAGVITHRLGGGFALELPIAAVMGAAVAVGMGLIALRSTASSFLILTFALAELLVVIFTNWRSLTGGPLGLVQAESAGRLGPFDFSDRLTFYFLCVGILAALMAGCIAIRYTAFGLRLTSIRDNERLARSLGLNTYLHKLAIFSLSGAVAAIGGVLFLYQDKYIEPGLFTAFTAITIQLVVIVGSVGSPIGPVVGAVFVAFLPEVLHLTPNQSELAYGLVLVMVILLLPQGLTRGLQDAVAWLPAAAERLRRHG